MAPEPWASRKPQNCCCLGRLVLAKTFFQNSIFSLFEVPRSKQLIFLVWVVGWPPLARAPNDATQPPPPPLQPTTTLGLIQALLEMSTFPEILEMCSDLPFLGARCPNPWWQI